MRIWNKRNKEKVKETHRNYKLKKRYGISAETYDKMFEAQGGACAICVRKPDEQRLSVDHCHNSSKIRALLCSQCNTGIGLFRESEAILKKAIAYLRKHR